MVFIMSIYPRNNNQMLTVSVYVKQQQYNFLEKTNSVCLYISDFLFLFAGVGFFWIMVCRIHYNKFSRKYFVWMPQIAFTFLPQINRVFGTEVSHQHMRGSGARILRYFITKQVGELHYFTKYQHSYNTYLLKMFFCTMEWIQYP